jgi:tRNA threonylcarbamoyladenosine biosynthesis protein TsaB
VIILALDTTTRAGSVAVTDDGRVLALLAGDESRTHGERLPGEIARALEMASIAKSDLDLLAVATGPGAFTGLRIGLAAIQGMAMALNKSVVGISALDALSAQAMLNPRVRETNAECDLIVPWMDAQRGDVFAAIIDRASRRSIESPAAGSPAGLLEAWRTHLAGRTAIFIGEAAMRDAKVIAAHATGHWEARAPGPLAAQIAALARDRADQAGPPHSLEPIYVRRPDAEIERDNRRRPKAGPARDAAREGGER